MKPRLTMRAHRITRARGTQSFWVTVAVSLIAIFLSYGTVNFASRENLFNITRNASYIAIMALGQTAVIIAGGIDLSVGSVMGLSGVAAGLVLESGQPVWLGLCAGLGTALLCGLANGILIAYAKVSPFVVTLGTLSIARSVALVLSNNKMINTFGPDEDTFLTMAGGEFLGLSTPVVVLIGLTMLFVFIFCLTRWGRYMYAIGGSEYSARLSGIPVGRVKVSVYILSALSAGLAALLTIGWLGSVTSAMGSGYELTVIAAAVIGGAALTGGEGGAWGAVIGALLMEVIRNGLLLAGVDPYWQGTFVGAFIIFAVLLEKLRSEPQRG